MFKKSGNPKVEELTKSYRDRQYNLSDLSVIKIDNIRYCVWCAVGVLHHGNQKYCTQECSRSAMAWAYPQKEENLAQLLIKQDYKCNICKYDYVPFMDGMAAKGNRGYSTNEHDWRNHYIWHFYKRLKRDVPKERRPEVDHIEPIYRGGTPLGLDNHQVICYTCHKAKSKVDNSGPRPKK